MCIFQVGMEILMGLAIAGILVNLLGAMVVGVQAEEIGGSAGETITLIAWSFSGLSVLGLVLAAAGMKKAGGIMIIVGSILFVPIGLIGVFGGKKIIGGTDDIEARRRLAEDNQGIKHE
jgi:hypothetical protein